MKYEEIMHTVETINDISLEVLDPECIYMFCLEYITNGYVGMIEFMGEEIWNSQDDPREWDDDKEDYEPLRGFLLRGMRQVLYQASLLGTKLHELKEGIDSTKT